MNKSERLKSLELKMQETYQKYNNLIIQSNKYKDTFGGFKVWYSPVKFNAKVMIIGINPGENELNEINVKPQNKFEYINPASSYILANKANKSFKMADLAETFENDTIKTNLYHIITKNGTKRFPDLNKIQKGLKNEFINNSFMFLKEMIEIISPENVICEGKTHYDQLRAIYNDGGETFWGNGVGYTKISNPNFNLIGFHRRASKPESISKILKKVIHCE